MDNLRKLYKPNFGFMEADKEYDITEVRLRFELDAALPRELVVVAIMGEINKSIQLHEQYEDWKVISHVPSKARMKGKTPCCLQMAQPAGTPLKLVIKPSEFQGDTDDAHNFGEMSDPTKRIYVDGKIDWVAITHFLVPCIFVNQDQVAEDRAAVGPEQGLARWEDIPADYWPSLRKRLGV